MTPPAFTLAMAACACITAMPCVCTPALALHLHTGSIAGLVFCLPTLAPLPRPLRKSTCGTPCTSSCVWPLPCCHPLTHTPTLLAALNSEQKALLDFIVLARGKRFVGFGSSTFSFFLREFRALHGISRSTSGLVDASVIGTDPLFHSAGTIV